MGGGASRGSGDDPKRLRFKEELDALAGLRGRLAAVAAESLRTEGATHLEDLGPEAAEVGGNGGKATKEALDEMGMEAARAYEATYSEARVAGDGLFEGCLVAASEASLTDALRGLLKRSEVVRFRNHFRATKAYHDGYRDATFELRACGAVARLRVGLKALVEARDSETSAYLRAFVTDKASVDQQGRVDALYDLWHCDTPRFERTIHESEDLPYLKALADLLAVVEEAGLELPVRLRIVDLAETVHGDDAEYTCSAIEAVGKTLWSQGKVGQAKAVFDRAEALRSQRGRGDDKSASASFNSLCADILAGVQCKGDGDESIGVESACEEEDAARRPSELLRRTASDWAPAVRAARRRSITEQDA